MKFARSLALRDDENEKEDEQIQVEFAQSWALHYGESEQEDEHIQ